MNKIFSLLLLLLFAGCKYENAAPGSVNIVNEQSKTTDADYERFGGDWFYENNQNGKTESTFELHFLTGDGAIKGSYCAVAQYGNKIDCSVDTYHENISGTIQNDTAFVNFTGIYSNKAFGKAKLYFENGSLVWQVIQAKGETFVPQKVLLTMGRPEPAAQSVTGNLPLSGEDLKNLPFKEISEDIIELNDYYCGMKPKFYELPMVNTYQVKIISNECGDFPFYALITTFKGKLTDKKVIYMEDWINPENENERSSINFTISKDYIITITEKKSVNGKPASSLKAFTINKNSGMIVPVTKKQ